MKKVSYIERTVSNLKINAKNWFSVKLCLLIIFLWLPDLVKAQQDVFLEVDQQTILRNDTVQFVIGIDEQKSFSDYFGIRLVLRWDPEFWEYVSDSLKYYGLLGNDALLFSKDSVEIGMLDLAATSTENSYSDSGKLWSFSLVAKDVTDSTLIELLDIEIKDKSGNLLNEQTGLDLPLKVYTEIPLTAAPLPTIKESNVISIFSDSYTNLTETDFNPDWGQETVTSIVDIEGNKTLRMIGLNYQGIAFGTTVNVSEMTHFHLDYWTTNSTALTVSLISPGPKEIAHSLTVPTQGWSSIDIPITEFSNLVDLTSLNQLKFEGNGDILIDNLYFFKETNLKNVTFRVDLSDAIAKNNFLPSKHAVTLSGSFNDWSVRGDTLFEANTAGIFEKTLEVEPGELQFKFVYSSVQYQPYEWDANFLTLSGNREITISGDTVTPIFTPNLFFNQIATDTTEKLLVHYQFNGDVSDASGNELDGEITDAQFVSNRYAQPNSALAFDGVNDHVLIGNQLELYQNYTISFWVTKTQSSSEIENIVDRENGITIYTFDGGLFFSIFNGTNWEEQGWRTINLQEWTQFTFSVSGKTVRFYKNGLFEFEFTFSSFMRQNSNPYYLGAYRGNYDFFQGSLDDFRVYNYALTDSDVESLHILETPPQKVQELNISSTESEVQLSWLQNTDGDISYYKIYRGIAENQLDSIGVTTADSPIDTVFIDSETKLPNTYYYAVSAVDKLGYEGQLSDAASITIAEQPFYNQNLIVHYPLNGNATDSSANQFLGTLFGTSPTVDRFGISNKALAFNGSSDRVQVSHRSTLVPANITISVWAKSETEVWNKPGMLVSKRNSYILHPEEGTKKLAAYIWVNGNWVSTPFVDVPADLTSWNHYVFTYDGLALRLFVNGKQIASIDQVGSVGNGSSGSLYLGFDNATGSRYFNGALDDIRIYSRGFTPEEVLNLYDFERPKVGTPESIKVERVGKGVRVEWEIPQDANWQYIELVKGEDSSQLNRLVVLDSAVTLYVDYGIESGKTYTYAVRASSFDTYSNFTDTLSITPEFITTIIEPRVSDVIEINQWSELTLSIPEETPAEGLAKVILKLHYDSSSVAFQLSDITYHSFWGNAYAIFYDDKPDSSFIQFYFDVLNNTNRTGSGDFVTIPFLTKQIGNTTVRTEILTAKSVDGILQAVTGSTKVIDITEEKVIPTLLTPQNLSAKGYHNQVRLFWEYENQGKQTYFRIYRGLVSGDLQKIDSTNFSNGKNHTYVDLSVVNDTEYRYAVQAVESNSVISPLTNPIQVTPTSPSIVTNLNRVSPDHLIQIRGEGFGETSENSSVRFVVAKSVVSKANSVKSVQNETPSSWKNFVSYTDIVMDEDLLNDKERVQRNIASNSVEKSKLDETPILQDATATIVSWSDTLITVDTPDDLNPGNYSVILNLRGEDIAQNLSFSVLETVEVWPGDTNNDGNVSASDLMKISIYFGQSTSDSLNGISWKAWKRPVWTSDAGTPKRVYADANGDGTIDVFDLQALDVNYGKIPENQAKQKAIEISQTDSVSLIAIWEQVQDQVIIQFKVDKQSDIKIRGMAIDFTHEQMKNGLESLSWVNNRSNSNTSLQILQMNAIEGRIQAGIAGDGVEESSARGLLGVLSLTGLKETIRENFQPKKWELWNLDGTRFIGNIRFEQVVGTASEWLQAAQIPTQVELKQNYPNPFNPSTVIQFNLPEMTSVELNVFNTAGQLVKEVLRGNYGAGMHRVQLDVSGWSSGVYYYQLRAGITVLTKKMMVVK